ncbi:MAG: ABC transporter ATP-binding protein/permease [Erysipelotrichaceae bacterium]|nr:ABC transporter ATP-binding protein/permease [Erysipelotrichaceae bacterium]
MIKLEKVSKYYHENNIVTKGLDNINLEFKLGEFVAIVGESGSGKSTLLNVIAGNDTYEDGELYINNKPTSAYVENDWNNYRREQIGFIFQNYHLIDSYTVYENVEAALVLKNVSRSERKERINSIIERVGLAEHKHTRAAKLSGGEKQRVAIARAIAKDTPIIVADEPTGNLDAKSGQEILQLLGEIAEEKLVFVVTHNYPQVEPFATRKITLSDGSVIEDKTIRKVEPKFIKSAEMPGKKANHSLYFAWKNFIRQPKRSILLLLVAIFAVLYVGLQTAGAFLNRNTILEGATFNLYFNNLSPSRLVVTREDGKDWSDDDTRRLGSLVNVASLMENDEMTDETFPLEELFPRERFIASGDLVTDPDINYGYYSNPYYRVYDRNLKIYRGRAPKNSGEFVLSYEYADRFKSSIDWEEGKLNTIDQDGFINYGPLKLVGFAVNSPYDYRGAYFLEEDIDAIYEKIVNFDILDKIDVIELNYNNEYIETLPFDWVEKSYNETLANDVVVNIIKHSSFENPPDVALMQDVPGIGLKYLSGVDIVVNYVTKIKISNTAYIDYIQIEFSQAFLDKFSREINKKQASVFVSDPMFKSFTISQIERRGYRVADVSGMIDDADKMFADLLTFFFIIGFAIQMFIVGIITYFILRTILANKMKDYAILTTIGLERSEIRKVSFLELIIPFSLAFALAVILFLIGRAVIVSPLITPFLLSINIVVLFTIFLVTLLLSIIIVRRFFKYVKKVNLLSEIKGGAYL